MTTPLLECTVLQLGLASISLAGRWVCPECRGAIASVLVAEPAINAHRTGCSRRPSGLPWQPSDGPREKPVTHEQIAALFTAEEIRAALEDRAEYMHRRPPVLKSHREKRHEARQLAVDSAEGVLLQLGMHVRYLQRAQHLLRNAFNAGYEAAEPHVCARCGAEIEGER